MSAHPYSCKEGAVFNHREIIKNEPIPYTVISETQTHVILLPKEDMDFVMKESEALRTYAAMDTPDTRLYEHRSDQHSRL